MIDIVKENRARETFSQSKFLLVRTAPTTTTTTLPPAELSSRLRLAATRLARGLRRQSGSGLTPSRHSALAVVARRGPLTLGELAEREGVAPPSITRVVARLEADGLVARETDTDDRRVTRVSATPAGEAVLAASRDRKDQWLRRRLDALDADQRARLAAALDVLEELAAPEPP